MKKEDFITFQCNTQRFQVRQEVSSKINFENLNDDLKLSFFKVIYGTWLVEIDKEMNLVLLRNAI